MTYVVGAKINHLIVLWHIFNQTDPQIINQCVVDDAI